MEPRARTLLVRVTRSAYADGTYAHITATHRAQTGEPNGWDTLYRYEHPAAQFALSAQCGGNTMPNGAPMWYAWRVGFAPDAGSTDAAICAETAERDVRGCMPIVRRIRVAMEKAGASWERSPATALLITARKLGCQSITLQSERGGAYARLSLDAASDALVRAILAAEDHCIPSLRKPSEAHHA